MQAWEEKYYERQENLKEGLQKGRKLQLSEQVQKTRQKQNPRRNSRCSGRKRRNHTKDDSGNFKRSRMIKTVLPEKAFPRLFRKDG